MRVKSESAVAQSCPILSDPMDCSLPGSSIHEIFQARVLSGVPLPSLIYFAGNLKNHNISLLLCLNEMPGNLEITLFEKKSEERGNEIVINGEDVFSCCSIFWLLEC